jgi:Ig-like domain-containing protein
VKFLRLFAAMVCFVATTAGATTLLPFSDRDLVEHADAIVIGTVADTYSHRLTGGAIVTDTRLRVEEVLKGSAAANELITIREAGGLVGTTYVFIPSSAHYSAGERALAFVRRADDGRWLTTGMSLGKFAYDADSRGREVLVRSTDGEADDRPRLASLFASFVRDVAAGRTPSSVSYISSAPLAKPEFKATTETTASNYTIIPPSLSFGVRWPGQPAFTVNYGTTGSIAGVATSATAAANAWHNAPNSNISFASGQAAGSDASAPDSKNTVYFGYSGSTPPGFICQDTKACTVLTIDTAVTHTFSGETFYTLKEVDVLFKSAFSFTQAEFDVLMTHELGHAIGLRHSNQGSPSDGNAVMASTTNVAFGTTLQQWDKDAVATVYGSGPPCVPPGISSQTQNTNVSSGSSATLSVSATGTSPYSYQWYRGDAGDTSNPVANANSSTFQTPPITTVSKFWVKVGNGCGTINSATITLTPTQCIAPSITGQPQGAAINSGSTANLTVTANGGPFTYQWYIGQSGDQSNPAPNGTSQNFTTPPLTQQSLFWVKVSNVCGSANSATATITINGVCTIPAISNNPGNVSIGIGETPDVTLVVTGATSMQWYQGQPGDTSHPLAGATTGKLPTDVVLSVGTNTFWLQAANACGTSNSGALSIVVNCILARPTLSVPATVINALGYIVGWSGGTSFVANFELQESTSPTFAAGSTQTFIVTGATLRAIAPHSVNIDTRYYYRVRAFPTCGGATTDYSDPGSVLVVAPPSPNSSSFSMGLPYGTTNPFNVNFIVNGAFNKTGKKGIAATESFTVSFDVPWLSANPKNGTIGADGSPTPVTLTIDPGELPFGSSQGTMTISHTDTASSLPSAQATTTTTVPLSVSLVSPVTPTPKDTSAPAGTLVVPAVAHADGVGTQFVSDMRVTNTTSQAIQYLLTFTGIATDGTQSGKQMKVNIAAGDTLALNDIVKSWFGAGAAGEGGIGSIEVRPLNAPASSNGHSTVGASRTYASTPTGTFGQFIPALPSANFLAKSNSSLISLQQVAQSTSFRTNFGLVEGSGQSASVQLTLFNAQGAPVAQNTFNLRPYELQQFSFSNAFPNTTVDDGRVEAKVLSDTGKISAYASVLDNKTNDPLLVLPVDPTKVSANTFVIPGVGDFDTFAAHWKSDVRVYNGSSSSAPVTMTYYPMGNGTPRAITATLAPGEVKALDNFIASQFPGMTQTAGSLVVTAPSSSSLITTARTYTDTGNGTYGQFIPGVTPTEGVGAGERALQVLQLEESPSFHTNAGIVELTGNTAHVKMHLIAPEGRTQAVVEYDIAPYEFRQFGSIFKSAGYGNVYNGRIAVEVTDGTGRVTAYGSNIDNQTQDPTYVPAQ